MPNRLKRLWVVSIRRGNLFFCLSKLFESHAEAEQERERMSSLPEYEGKVLLVIEHKTEPTKHRKLRKISRR
jgi:hypothetical protein